MDSHAGTSRPKIKIYTRNYAQYDSEIEVDMFSGDSEDEYDPAGDKMSCSEEESDEELVSQQVPLVDIELRQPARRLLLETSPLVSSVHHHDEDHSSQLFNEGSTTEWTETC